MAGVAAGGLVALSFSLAGCPQDAPDAGAPAVQPSPATAPTPTPTQPGSRSTALLPAAPVEPVDPALLHPPVERLPAGFLYRSPVGTHRFCLAPGPAAAAAGDRPGQTAPAPTVFIPLGLNYAWPATPNAAAEYQRNLPMLAHAGVNLLRVWSCTWGFDLGGWNTQGKLDGPGVAGLDALFRAAEKDHVKILLVYDNHTDLLQNQAKHGLFLASGAPGAVCSSIADYFQLPAARAVHAARVKAILARYGSSPAFFGLEFFNELDLVLPVDILHPNNIALLADWARFMAGVVDDQRREGNLAAWHPIGLSTAWPRSFGCYLDNRFDWVSVHAYIPESDALAYNFQMDETDLVAETTFYFDPALVATAGPGAVGRLAHRPWLMEYGFASGGSTSPRNADDPTGNHLRHGMWAALAAGGEGPAMPWWWDSYILPDNLERLYTPLKHVAAELPWDQTAVAVHFHRPTQSLAATLAATPASVADARLPVHSIHPASPADGAHPPTFSEAYWLVGTDWTDAAFLYVVAGDANWLATAQVRAAPAHIQAQIDAGKFAAGRYRVDWIDPATGKPAASTQEIDHPDGELRLTTPIFTDDLAVVIHRIPASR